MRKVSELPRLLISWSTTLSTRVSLSIIIVTSFFSASLFVINFPETHNGSILSLPIALASWIFKRRGAFISTCGTILLMFVVHTMVSNGLFWSSSLIISFFLGTFTLSIEACLTVCLRNILDTVDAARIQAEQAEQQLAIAYEQQNNAYEQQLQLNQMKDQFLLHVNHELRTPLTEISGFLELLLEQGVSLTPELRTVFIQHAQEGCEELHLLINKIMEAVRANNDTAPLQKDTILVAQIVHEILDQFDPRKIENHHLKIEISKYIFVAANALHLRQILRNLLSNAFKYSPLHSSVVISAQPQTSQEGETSSMICISIHDSGPGIPSDELPLLFGKFVRLQRDVSGPIRGTGLGLYICKQLVEAMGGQIWVESSGIAGQGSCFSFTLPAVTSPVQTDVLHLQEAEIVENHGAR